MKIARIVGARPQFMQVKVVTDALVAAGHTQTLIHTGQHYDANLSEVFFRELEIDPPEVNLEVGSGSHGVATGAMLSALDDALTKTKPDAVLVDGDTNSTMAAALSAVKLHIPVLHIEAGLRDFDRRRPEEINRIVTDHVATANFAPIPRAMENLATEGLAANSHLVGDVLLDTFLDTASKQDLNVLEALHLSEGAYDVMTLHRPENTDMSEYARFSAIMSALSKVEHEIVFPVHPRTRPILDRYAADQSLPSNLKCIQPVSYFEMRALVAYCNCVITDSGGLPREAVWSERKCVMLFRVDTWHDLLERQWAQIGKTDEDSILQAYAQAKSAPAQARELYGGGRASERIAQLIGESV